MLHTQSTYANGSGQTVKTEQYPSAGNTIRTLFEYDAINQLTKVTDAMGKSTNSVYDKAGRRTQVSHPASGTTNFIYDAAGNLTGKQTANMIPAKKKIKYAYTFNRLDTISYPDHPENNVIYRYGLSNDTSSFNRKGRLVYQEDGSGGQEFKYGKMGELTEVRRTLVVPNQAIATYVTNWTYDCWNRVKTMTYPDGNRLYYSYDFGGMPSILWGIKLAAVCFYADSIKYDKFGQRTHIRYGNGTVTSYTYNDSTRNLTNLTVLNSRTKKQLMNNVYHFDRVNNVESVTNYATLPTGKAFGGNMTHTYTYDNLYRLKTASGIYTGSGTKAASYSLGMDYDNLNNITHKTQRIKQFGIQYNDSLMAGYDLTYAYANNQQQISNIADLNYRTDSTNTKKTVTNTHRYSYDANGNLVNVNTGKLNSDSTLTKSTERKILWDEENRLLALSDNGFVSNYWYDASGERTVKESGEGQGVFVKGVLSGAQTGTTNFTAYVNPYLVVSPGGNYSTHVYIGSQRISSMVGSPDYYGVDPRSIVCAGKVKGVNTINYDAKYTTLMAKLKTRYDSVGVTYHGIDNKPTGTTFFTGKGSNSIEFHGSQYYYHSDHLGSSSIMTDLIGNVSQHIEYIPFGDVFIEERNDTMSTPYKFNGKELDEETGLYYYGARYYDPRTSVWISADPLAEKYPNVSSYVYCLDNPVKFIDIDGKKPSFENMTNKNHYGFVFVCQNNITDRVNNDDYLNAKEKGIPILRVDNIKDFQEGMKIMKEKGISTNAYLISQHGSEGSGNIGDEEITAKTDFSPLKEGLGGKNVILAQCDITKGGANLDLIENFSKESNSNVVSADHLVPSKTTTNQSFNWPPFGISIKNGKLSINFTDLGPISNDFHQSKPNQKAQPIFNVTLKPNGTILYNRTDNNK